MSEEDKPKERHSNGRFAEGRKKTGGRKVGSPASLISRPFKEWASTVAEDGEVQLAVRARMLKGDTAAFFRAVEHAHGKPKEQVAHELSGTLEIRWKGEE
jgi:hypothetical protein